MAGAPKGRKRPTSPTWANETGSWARSTCRWARPSVPQKDREQKPTIVILAQGPSLPWSTSPTGAVDFAGPEIDHPTNFHTK